MQNSLSFDAGAALRESRRGVLDDPAQWPEFSRALPRQPDLLESYFAIEGMYCAACSLTVEALLRKQTGIEQVQVSGASAVARVVWSPQHGRPSAWVNALEAAGYGAVPAGDMFAARPRLQAQRLMLWRWLVAAFCMMQVMMYATPVYLARPDEITPDIEALLRWASWILTLPVLLFSCRPFFDSALRDLRHGRIGMDVPVALGVLIAFGASTAATFDRSGPLGGEVWYDSVTMFVFFLLSGRLLEARLRNRTAGALEALMRRLPDSVECRQADGEFRRVSARRLVVGDVVRVLPGEVFPADGTVLTGDSQVDEALLTGESHPLSRRAGQTVIAGSHNLSGPLVLQVDRLGPQTRYAQIVALMEQASASKPRLALLADRIAGHFLLGVLLASAGAAAWWWAAGPAHAVGVAVAVLIVTCPCALSLATPAATLAAAGSLARRGVLVRDLAALEAAARVDTVVFDKTGTLTEDRMRVQDTRVRSGLAPVEAQQLAATLAAQSLHPVSRAIAREFSSQAFTASAVGESAGQGMQGRVVPVAGGPARLLRLGSAAFCGMSPADDNGADDTVQAAGGSRVHLADESGWLATFTLEEAIRPDALEAVAALRRLGMSVQLLSGDRDASVRALAARVGIEQVFGERSPQDKLAHVRALQQAGHCVAMVGDGLNDGPVLACADVSIAMGHGAALSQARSDFVAMSSRIASLVALLQQAGRTRRVVRQNLVWAAAYNAVCVPLAVMGAMPPWLAGLGMAGSSLLVILNSARLSRLSADTMGHC
ncbi:MAG: cation-translocating P-type ATPase [Burkholderiaceae bacterium]|nr:cation-translocating P-type ATPase [Burkholderiaceae bacterium]